MKSQDIVILLKLVSLEEKEAAGRIKDPAGASMRDDIHSVRGLGAALSISKSEVSQSLNRSLASGLALRDRKLNAVTPNRRNLYDFITHGLKFVFPVKPGAPTRGIPTAFAATMLQGQLVSGGADIYVWPYAEGKLRGLSVKPLFNSVPEAVENDQGLYKYLAIIDAIRLGRPRESGLAAELLKEGLLGK